MDVFSITCTTCKSRLKVRDPAVIGQILACPKCGGMVLVKPPDQQAGVEAPPPAITAAVDVATLRQDTQRQATVESSVRETIGDSTFGDIDALLSDAPPKVKTPAPTLLAPRSVPAVSSAPAPMISAPVISAPLKLARRTPAEAATHAAAEPKLAPNPAEQPGDSEPPPLDWVAARPWRYWALLTGSLVSGVVLAVAVAAIAIQLFQDDASATVAEVPAVPSGPAQGAKQSPEKTPSLKPINTPTENPATDTKPIPNTPIPVEPITEVKTPTPAVEPKQPVSDPLGLTDPPLPATESPASAVAKVDPLGAFGKLVEGGSDNPLPANEVPAEAVIVPSSKAEAIDEAPERVTLPRPPARPIKLTARLADPLPAIDVDGVPLTDFLQLMSDLSTIPITLAPDSLWFIKSSPGALVTLHASNTTVGAALNEGLQSLGLAAIQIDDQIVVELIRVTPPRAIKFPVQDLTEGDEQQALRLADWMTSLVAAGTWNAEDSPLKPEAEPDSLAVTEPDTGPNKIVVDKQSLLITQEPAVHAALFLFCEKLRVARGLKPLTGAKYDPALFQLQSRTARASAKLSTPITLNFSQPTSLLRIAERLGATAKLRILIDWRSLAALGWTTETEATLLADKLPLEVALTQLLEPLELAWRVVDDKTLQVTTPEALAARLEVEFYPAAALADSPGESDKLLARIAAALGPETLHERDGPGELRFDPVGKCLLAALPQPEQQKLERLLNEWRGAAQPAAAALNSR